MYVVPTAGEVRAIVRRTLLELGVESSLLADLAETLMIDEGQIRARSYRLDDYMAMWLMDVGILQFYDADGNMLRRTNLHAEFAPHRVAA